MSELIPSTSDKSLSIFIDKEEEKSVIISYIVGSFNFIDKEEQKSVIISYMVNIECF